MRRTSITLLAGAAPLPLIALAVAGCGGSSSAKPTAASGPPKTALGQTATVGAQNDGNLGAAVMAISDTDPPRPAGIPATT
jgi:hypothetical protein